MRSPREYARGKGRARQTLPVVWLMAGKEMPKEPVSAGVVYHCRTVFRALSDRHLHMC
jgi:hypothetical protein